MSVSNGMTELVCPFPWFGGKSKVSNVVWRAFGADVYNYVEPFFGSGAVLLGRPGWTGAEMWIETVNDADGFLANFWRAVQSAPDEVAQYADWPVNESDLHARHTWLRDRRETLTRRLEGDPEYYDAQIAGWWVWGICAWIGSGWCDPMTTGPWCKVEDDDGYSQLVRAGNGNGQKRQRVHLSNDRGVHRQLIHLGSCRGVHRQLIHLGRCNGVHRQRIHLGDSGVDVHRPRVHLSNDRGVHRKRANGDGLYTWMETLAARLRRVRVAVGDWSRVCGPSPTTKLGTTAVFLDPPYSLSERDSGLYANDTDHDIASDVRQWCLENGDNPQLRIALCGYDTEHGALDDAGWTRYTWSTKGGYAKLGNNRGKENKDREVIWFSPYCLQVETHTQIGLFG